MFVISHLSRDEYMTIDLILPVNCGEIERILDETMRASVQPATIGNGFAGKVYVFMEVKVALGLDCNNFGRYFIPNDQDAVTTVHGREPAHDAARIKK